MSHLLAKPLFFNRRIVFYLVILLSLQCIIAYGALLVFDSLPSSLTDMPDDHVVFRESQRGTVNLIRMRINENKNRPLQEVVDELQPYFGYSIEILPIDIALPHTVSHELKNLGFSYDSDKEVVYIDLNDGNLLQLGPIVMRDILQSNTMSLSVFLIIWALFSAIIFFILIYFAFSAVWKDLVNIRQTAEQLGQGNLKARTENVKGWLFKPLANVLNNMGTHIEHLVSTNQTISHAMAHELRTPLARMRFELSMLEESNDEQEKLLLQKGMSDDINELETLISASLNYFKMQQSNIELNLTQVSLKQWGEKVCQSLALFKPKEFELTCNSQDVLAIIDTNLAETIVKNLLLNAFKYATHKAVLNITKQKNSVIIEIDDDGPGIPFEAREKIFMPFARLDTSRTRSTGGYGLGLAYVKLMAEFHNGNAFVVTSPLGGARFVVSLKSNDC
ncbi:Sensory histidine kinase in two-component regulatory system with RstA [Gilliamella apicola]|uniref:ATP-binding protein n=1 Tax=Gilliamella apicola TaxID=1196095 RepID=UPI00042ECD81|nr:ATP-binding protein [Gilliamella apicola]AHN24822.1 Sensory histidine kinase in two-component regulatory system with RstA [Gilliamella apicola]PXV96687.1 two-component system sensor histidine kinase RstB/two-component system sensor kinase ParS [Gilliamella apicola]